MDYCIECSTIAVRRFPQAKRHPHPKGCMCGLGLPRMIGPATPAIVRGLSYLRNRVMRRACMIGLLTERASA